MKVAQLGMTHVKCTRFLEIEKARFTPSGIAGDREFVLVNERGELLGPERHAPFLPLQFEFSEQSGVLALRFPDGRFVSAELKYADQCRHVDYLGMREIALRKVLGDWDSLLSQFSGQSVSLYRCRDRGQGIDVKPITLLTTASVRELSRKLGASVDSRRFRANLIIDCDTPHIEDSWEGGLLEVGSSTLRVLGPVPRCIVTQLDPESGDENLRLVAKLQAYRPRVSLPDGLLPNYRTPGFASYAEVVKPGEVAIGDSVTFRGF